MLQCSRRQKWRLHPLLDVDPVYFARMSRPRYVRIYRVEFPFRLV